MPERTIVVPAEADLLYRRLTRQGTLSVGEVIQRGIEVLLAGADEELGEEEQALDVADHLVRTRAMQWAMLAEATELQRKYREARAEREWELTRTPQLQERYRRLQRLTRD